MQLVQLYKMGTNLHCSMIIRVGRDENSYHHRAGCRVNYTHNHLNNVFLLDKIFLRVYLQIFPSSTFLYPLLYLALNVMASIL